MKEIIPNKYQEKLAAIQARRLPWSQRILSLVASVSLLCAGIVLVPTTLSFIYALIISGSIQGLNTLKELGVPTLFMTIMAIPSLIYLVYHCFSWCLKHFVRLLSGIKEGH